MNLRIFLVASFFMTIWDSTFGQIVTVDPVIFTANEPITITYDASQGNAGLLGITSDIHMHSAAITDGPESTAWTYKVGEWGNPNVPGIMTYIGNDKWQINLNSIREFYSVPEDVPVYRLGMVFRQSGPCGDYQGATSSCKAGRTATGGDIFVEVSQGGFDLALSQPGNFPVFKSSGETLSIVANASEEAAFTVKVNDNEVVNISGQKALNYEHVVTETGIVDVTITASNGVDTKELSFSFVVRSTAIEEPRATGILDGINYDPEDGSKVVLSFLAPFKSSVYVLGDFNDWKIDPALQMKKDGEHFWIELNDLEPGVEYAFQYLVDEEIYVVDPFCDKILDSKHDQDIGSNTYPNLRPYPDNAAGVVSVLQTDQQPYNWNDTEFVRPPAERLNVYELLIRDFNNPGNYQSVIDRLDYIKSLGINAIELMPVMEFGGNSSWGYNPYLYFAPDKAYGPKIKLKELIDKAHSMDIAVILDMVLNHADYEFPYAKMYWSGSKPSEDNPFFNRDAKHPYNVYYDFNHESLYTQALVDTVNRYWLSEYHFDGFRFDLSKGFTQTYNTDVGAWGSYDQSRVDILTRMADKIWAFDSSAYIILEHLGVDDEERVLANYGMTLWDKMTDGFKQNTLGFSSNSSISRAYYKNHSGNPWTNTASIMAYMESHDEQRIMYYNLEYGNTHSNYNARELNTALDRTKGAFAFLFGIPGPKMIWQFGELGYDVSIDENGRTGPKPILWEYFDEPKRKKLYQTVSQILLLRNQYDVFHTKNVQLDLDGDLFKTIVLNNETYSSSPESPQEMNVVIVGNFDVTYQTGIVPFRHSGTWYNYFSQCEEFQVDNTQLAMELQPGEFRIYTDVKLDPPPAELMAFVKPLSPELISVDQVGSSVSLLWKDNSGIEEGFHIYRKENNQEFKLIGSVNQNVSTYTDNNISSAVNYEYLIEAYNNSGSNLSSSLKITPLFVLGLGIFNDGDLKVFPNPVKSEFAIGRSEELLLEEVLVFDVCGKLIKQLDINSKTFNVADIKSGTYILSIKTSEGSLKLRFQKL